MTSAFVLFIFLVTAEYIGLGNYLSLYKSLPIALALSLMLFMYVVINNPVLDAFKHKQVKYFFLFILMTVASLAYGLIRSEAIDPSKSQIGYFLFLLIACFVVFDKDKIRIYSLVFVISHAMMVIINIDKFGQARMGAYKAGFFLGDGNDFAWSVNIAFPLCLCLLFIEKKLIYKIMYLSLSGILLLGIVGTQSRGASLALAAGFVYYFFFIAKKKATGIILVALVAMGTVLVAPENYFSRMETLGNYEADTSAMGRIRAWRTASEMALDHPVLGVGAGSFNSAYGRFYRKPDDPVRWISTHSVYFKILGEYGFTGIFIYLMIIYHNIKTNAQSARLLESLNDKSLPDPVWPLCLNWSIISCSVAAMFLSGIDYPHLFLLTGITIAISRMIPGKLTISGNSNQPNNWHDSDNKNTVETSWK